MEEQDLLQLKGNHRIGVILPSICEVLDDGDNNVLVVCDADGSKFKQHYYEDDTPDWLYDILNTIDPGYQEDMESVFRFSNFNSKMLLLSIADEIYNQQTW